MASWKTYLQVLGYIALLFFFIPIRIHGPNEQDTKFEEYLKRFNKTYDDPDLYQRRLQAFQQSLETIDIMNSNQTDDSARYGLTKFSDMLPEEFLHNHLQTNMSQRLFKYHPNKTRRKRNNLPSIPNKIDWRQKNVVTKVHNQGECGSCWAFSSVETFESMNAIKTDKLEDFSVQEIIDCAGNNDGCNGGDVCSLLTWMKDTNFTLHRASDYHGKSGHCKISDADGVRVEEFVCESLVGSEEIVLDLLATNGPVAVAINAKTWQHYVGGVIKYHCDGDPANLNHAVQIVGYDLTTNTPHYIVRNSWGEDFGDGGYLYVAVEQNMCGLANEVTALQIL